MSGVLPGLLLLAALPVSHAGEQAQGSRTLESKPALHQTSAYDQLLREADTLIRKGKPAAAYALLEPFEFEHAGEVRFDYLIGIAALDSGKADKATFAFERVLAVNPDFVAARLDMARAYYQLGDFPRARTEFTAVLKQNPSKEAQANIQKYLDAIEARQQGRRVRITAYVQGSVGHDSNVNYSTSEQRIFVDRFATTAIIDPNSLRASDKYFSATTGAEVEYPIGTEWSLYAAGDAQKRNNSSNSQYNALNLDVRAGVAFAGRADRVRVGALRGQYDLGGTRNSIATGFKGEWRHAFNPANQLNAFAQYLQYRFADILMQPNDFDQQALGLGWWHALAGGKETLSASMHYGAEKDVSPLITEAAPTGGRADGAKGFGGLRVGSQFVVGEGPTLFASAGMQSGNFDKVNYYFQRQRKDRLYDVLIGANWDLGEFWTMRPQLSYTRNDSNIAIYEYRRMDVSLTVRRDFR